MTISWRSLPARLFIAIVIGGVFAARLPGPEAALAASDESTRYYERAQSYLAKGELKSAVIELKNSVRADPDNAVARYALGVALLQTGDAASAEKELKAARDHGFEEARLVDPLARSFLVQGRYQPLLDTLVVKDQSPALSAQILGWRGYAFIGLGREDAAKQSFAEAVQKDPKGS